MTETGYAPFDDDMLAGDGSQTWIGLLLVAICGFASVGMLVWLVGLFGGFFIH